MKQEVKKNGHGDPFMESACPVFWPKIGGDNHQKKFRNKFN